MRVTITGSEGLVGTILRRELAERFEVHALTRSTQSYSSTVTDVSDLDALVQAFAESDAVIHLAAAAALDASWQEVLSNNIVGTRNVYEAARQASVRTVIFASSGHVIGLEEERLAPGIYDLDRTLSFDELTPYAPDSLYAVSKVFGETLGRYYAETHGLRVICVRLGTVLPNDDPRSENGGQGRSARLSANERFRRIRAKWLSHRDCAELFRCCLETTSVSYAVVYGTSENPRQLWSLEGARQRLGYIPRDSAPR